MNNPDKRNIARVPFREITKVPSEIRMQLSWGGEILNEYFIIKVRKRFSLKQILLVSTFHL